MNYEESQGIYFPLPTTTDHPFHLARLTDQGKNVRSNLLINKVYFYKTLIN